MEVTQEALQPAVHRRAVPVRKVERPVQQELGRQFDPFEQDVDGEMQTDVLARLDRLARVELIARGARPEQDHDLCARKLFRHDLVEAVGEGEDREQVAPDSPVLLPEGGLQLHRLVLVL